MMITFDLLMELAFKKVPTCRTNFSFHSPKLDHVILLTNMQMTEVTVMPSIDLQYYQIKILTICKVSTFANCHIKIIKFLFKSLKLIMIIMLLSAFAKT